MPNLYDRNLSQLDATKQALWRCLGVFPGDFDGHAAAAVSGLPLDAALDALRDLTWREMLDHDETTDRYRLDDLGRRHALSQIGEAARRAVQRRHAAHFKDVMDAADKLYARGGASMASGLALFDRERTNIEAGQAWAAAHAATEDTAAALCSAYPDAGTYCLALRQAPREGIRWREAALVAARRLGLRDKEGLHLGNLGHAYLALGEPRRAVDLYEQLLAIARATGDRLNEGQALGSLGIAYRNLGEPRRAIELHEQHLTIARALGDRKREGNALGSLGLAYADLGEMRRAIELYEQQLTITRELGDRRREGHALDKLGLAYAELGEPRRAIGLHEQRLVIARELGDRQGEAYTSYHLGLCHEDLGELEKAVAFIQVYVDFLRAIRHADAEKTATYLGAVRARLKG